MIMRFSLGKYIEQLLESWGTSHQQATLLQVIITIVLLMVASVLAYYISRVIITKVFRFIIKRTKTRWDDIMFEKKVFKGLALLVPYIMLYIIMPYVIIRHKWLDAADSALHIYGVLIALVILDRTLEALNDIFMTLEISRSRPIKGYIQIIKIILYSIGFIIIISIILKKSPVILLTGFGAMSAILLLIFKDPILGFVSSIQLSSNDMVKPGDWISVPKHNADGIVIDINLTSVKVQNWDLSVTNVPTQLMISDSFLNWKGMEEGSGRRIKRSVYLDLNSVKFCSDEMLERFGKIHLISEYLKDKQKELEEYNRNNQVDDSVPVNGRRQTNIGVFRAYLLSFLKNHPYLHKDMTLLVRQLEPGEKGLPIEVYAFSTKKDLAEYENIQADIFDHILAIIPQFDLHVFQHPTGADFRSIRQ